MFRNWLLRSKPTTPFNAAITPAEPFAAIGDLHGRYDLLTQLLGQLPASLTVVCVGDLIDRGPDSAKVLRHLSQHPNTICLAGNHEEMMLDFLRDPVACGGRWLRHGGMQTLASFDILGVNAGSAQDQMIAARNALLDVLGEAMLNWLADLPSCWQSGNVAITHAGADPAVPIIYQNDNTLRWGHPDFTTTPRSDGTWVIHGHTIVDTPTCDAGRIAIDTGAYATGRLTAAVVDAGGVQFITT